MQECIVHQYSDVIMCYLLNDYHYRNHSVRSFLSLHISAFNIEEWNSTEMKLSDIRFLYISSSIACYDTIMSIRHCIFYVLVAILQYSTFLIYFSLHESI